jgi:polyphosphate kinase
MKPDANPLFFNRELSWLEFNQRVLEEALDPANPPLERLKFLAITASNLDEFFMVRVGGLQQVFDQGGTDPDPVGLPPEEQLAQISWRAHRMVSDQHDCWETLQPLLAKHGVRRLPPEALSPEQTHHVQTVFYHEIFPLLTPLAASGDAPFPVVPGLGLCLAVRLRTIGRKTSRFAIVPIPRNVSRVIGLEADKGSPFLLVEDAVRLHLDLFFPGEEVQEATAFRITRNADMAVREDLAGDLLSQMRRVLTQRRESACVRLEIQSGASVECMRLLKSRLGVVARDIYETQEPLALASFFTLGVAAGDDTLRAKAWPPCASPDVLPNAPLFPLLASRDLLLLHPFESFEPVQRLVQQAADDPDVLAIKQILYRTSPNSPIVAALARAAERGKQVTVIVELKARFDEARNIGWADALEQAGVQVIYGIKGLKTHAKLCLIIRREATGIRRYLHVGTGNYNETTARLYTDVSLMTSNPDLAADASLFFNTITGYSQPAKFRKLEAAPIGLRDRLLELIGGETARAADGQPAHIIAKVNALADPRLIEALYAASKAGVRVDLCVRGVCCLRPGVAGLSESIRVVSIVDRFLEHSRVFYFHGGGERKVFISSADWMPRNLDKRIELLVPVESPECRDRLIELLKTAMADTVKGRWLQPDGSYVRQKTGGRKAVRSQEVLYRDSGRREAEAARARTPVFEPHRPPTSGGQS